MSDENKKEFENPVEYTDDECDANAEAGSCGLLTKSTCGWNQSYSRTSRGSCGGVNPCSDDKKFSI